MNEVNQLIHESILKWQERADTPEKYIHATAIACPLCVAFRHNDCEGCPIANHTQKDLCQGNEPYHIYVQTAYNIQNDDTFKVRKQAAKDEVALLQSLFNTRTNYEILYH